MLPAYPVFILRLIITIARPRGKRSEKVVGEEMARAETGLRKIQGRNLRGARVPHLAGYDQDSN